MEYKSDQVRVTDKYLVVHFTGRYGTAIRHSCVKVPLMELALSASVCDGLERATRRALIEHWSGESIPDTPLF